MTDSASYLCLLSVKVLAECMHRAVNVKLYLLLVDVALLHDLVDCSFPFVYDDIKKFCCYKLLIMNYMILRILYKRSPAVAEKTTTITNTTKLAVCQFCNNS